MSALGGKEDIPQPDRALSKISKPGQIRPSTPGSVKCSRQRNKLWELVMSIWDQLAAATADLSIASFLHREQKQNRPLDDAVPFTVGMIALAAKMAKADGVITKDEVFAFEKAFKVSDLEMRQAARVFNLAKQDAGGYQACAEELVTVFKGDRKMLEYVLEGVFHIARADGAVHPKEEEFLRQVAKCFGFTDVEFTFMKARHTLVHERNPYDVLGVKASVSNEELS